MLSEFGLGHVHEYAPFDLILSDLRLILRAIFSYRYSRSLCSLNDGQGDLVYYVPLTRVQLWLRESVERYIISYIEGYPLTRPHRR